MNGEKVAAAGAGMAYAGCAMFILFWGIIPLVLFGVLWTLSAMGVLD